MTYLAETFNEYGTPVSMFQCEGCKTTFTVCPAVPEDRRDQWSGCMADDCSTYDEARDGDKLFDAGKVRRVGDRSHICLVPTTPQPAEGCSSNEGADGWIEWGGGENPVKGVEVKLRSGDCLTGSDLSSDATWQHIWGEADIIAYRVLPQTEKGS